MSLDTTGSQPAWSLRIAPFGQCNALSQSSLEVYFANTPSYEGRLEHIWSVDAALHPSCFVLPVSTEDVSLIAQTITKYQCPFGIVGGGHADYPGSNSVESGVTIDFGIYLPTYLSNYCHFRRGTLVLRRQDSRLADNNHT